MSCCGVCCIGVVFGVLLCCVGSSCVVWCIGLVSWCGVLKLLLGGVWSLYVLSGALVGGVWCLDGGLVSWCGGMVSWRVV